MTLLYKDAEDIKYSVKIEQKDGKVKMLFSCDGGKFGTEEMLDEIEIEPKRLLEILQENYENA